MSNRLQFRAFINASYYDKDDDDKEVQLKFDYISLGKYGEIGFSRDDLLSALYNTTLTDDEQENLIEQLNDNNMCSDDEYYVIDWGIVNQNTGLKDKNNKSIYEDDIVMVQTSDMDKPIQAVVKWNEDDASFQLIADYEHELPLYGSLIEIIGNKHEKI